MKQSIFLFCLLFLMACSKTNTKSNAQTEHAHHSPQQSELISDEDPFELPDSAAVFFANLQDGQEVNSPVHIQFGVRAMKVRPSGQVIKGTGHHHIIVDGAEYIKQKNTVPADAQHIHYGGGQTETELSLSPGKHKLSMQFADGVHRSYGKALSASVEIFVK